MKTNFFKSESGITKIDVNNGNYPTKFSVSQKYPNPFNPITTMTFIIPEKLFVTLEVFDSLGSTVAKLISLLPHFSSIKTAKSFAEKQSENNK